MVSSPRTSSAQAKLMADTSKNTRFGHLNIPLRHSTTTLEELGAAFEEENAGPEKDCEHVTSRRRSVEFGEIHVLEFNRELGDNPAVSKGCPLTMGWDVQSSSSYDLDGYEKLRPSSERRNKKNLRIPCDQRAQMLMEHGHTLEEIASMTLETLKIKDSREQRIHHQKLDKLYEAIVMTGHRLKKVASLPQLASLVSPEPAARKAISLSSASGEMESTTVLNRSVGLAMRA